MRLDLAVNRPLALVAARLCDVALTGASTLLITRGLLNLTHRDSHEDPSPLEPGKRYTVTVMLNVSGHALAAGHRLRLALSPTFWPHAWPSPGPVTLSVFTGGASSLFVPTRTARPDDVTLAPFGPAQGSGPFEVDILRAPNYSWTTSQRSETIGSTLGSTRRRSDGPSDLAPDAPRTHHEIVVVQDAGSLLHRSSGIEYDSVSVTTYSIHEDAPLSARIRCAWKIGVSRGAWRTRIETTSVMTADAKDFRITNVLDAYEGETRIFSRTNQDVVPRDLI